MGNDPSHRFILLKTLENVKYPSALQGPFPVN